VSDAVRDAVRDAAALFSNVKKRIETDRDRQMVFGGVDATGGDRRRGRVGRVADEAVPPPGTSPGGQVFLWAPLHPTLAFSQDEEGTEVWQVQDVQEASLEEGVPEPAARGAAGAAARGAAGAAPATAAGAAPATAAGAAAAAARRLFGRELGRIA
jgi:hypothetical protein